MKQKHTPGPWYIDKKSIGCRWNIETIKQDIALAQQIMGDDLEQNIRSANARLIAAAPTLLEAAKKALKKILHKQNGYSLICSKSCEHCILESAIAQAEGKEEIK